MKKDSFFQVLGIEPTKDEKSIKKAYRTLLRKVNPEDDAEGFKMLRQAYEEACAYAKKKEPEDPMKTAEDRLILKCEEVYQSFDQRITLDTWEEIFEEVQSFDLEKEDEIRFRFLGFLMEHFHFPWKIWKRIDQVFRISGCREELLEHFPEPYVDFLIQVVQYEGSLDYDLFEGEPGADYDTYIEGYQRLRQYTDLGMADQGWKEIDGLKKQEVYHPYVEVEEARLLLLEEKKGAAGEIFLRLGGKYEEDERILCCLAQYLGMEEDWERADLIYEHLLARYPDSDTARAGKAEVLIKKGEYRSAREWILDLLEKSPQDERLMKDLTDANVFMIEELEPGYQEGSAGQEEKMDLAWCYYQNMHFEDGLDVLDSFVPDKEHLLDYHNLKGRIYLTLDKNEEALVHLQSWLQEILKLQKDGTKKTERRLARLGYAYYTIGAAKAALLLEEKAADFTEPMWYFEQAIREEKEESQVISYYHTMADIWRQKKEDARVIEVCETILKRNPQYYPALLLRQEACLHLGMYQEAADDYQRAVSLYPYYAKPYAVLMKMYLLFGDYDRTREVLEKAKELHLDSDDLAVQEARLIAVTAKSGEDLEKALAILDRKKEQGWTNASDLDQEEWQEISFRRGLILTDLHRFAEAKEAFETVLKKREDFAVWYSYATVLLQMGDYEKAILYLEKILERSPGDDSVLYKLGWCLKMERKYEEALSCLKKVLLYRPDHPSVRQVITEIYERMARREEDNRYYEKALPYMEEQLARYPDSYHYIEMGLLYLDMDRYKEAFTHFEKAFLLDPESLYAYNNAGNCCLSLKEPQKAIPFFKKAISLMKNEITPLPYNNLAKCYRMLKWQEEAEACYRKNMELFPEETDLYLLLGEFYRENERYGEAIASYREGIKKGKNKSSLEFELLRTLAEAGKKEESRKYAGQLMEKYPDDAVLHQLTGEIFLYGFKEYEKAEKLLLAAVRLADSGKAGFVPGEMGECFRGSLYLYGRCLLVQERKEAAKKAFLKYLAACRDENQSTARYEEFYGESKRRRFRMGCVFWFLGEYDRAKDCFNKVSDGGCRCDGCGKSCCYEGMMGSALLLYAKGKKKEAFALYEEARRAVPNDLEHRFEADCLGQGLYQENGIL